jgi:hypothetical protein
LDAFSIYAMHLRTQRWSDGNFYDAVIPGYIEPEMFPLQEKKEDYYLYVGRMVDRKGIAIAQHVCKEMGLELDSGRTWQRPKD